MTAAAEIADVTAWFASRLPERLREIEEAWAEAAAAGWSGAAAERLHRLAHSLAGAGGTFGFAAAGVAAKALERAVQEIRGGILPPPPVQVERAAALLAALRQAIPLPASSPPAGRPLPECDPAHERLLLLVEDDGTFGEGLTHQLRQFGYRVRLLTRLDELGDASSEEPASAILMDMMFPEGSLAGVERIHELRRARALPKVVFLSAREDLEARLAAVHAGADAYFTKPVDVGALVERLDALTGRRPAAPYRVLLVGGAPEARRHAGILEQAGMVTATIADPLAAVEPLARFQADALLVDLDQPGCGGPELVAALRLLDELAGTPILFLSAERSRELQLAALDRGADDVLTKPVDAEHLPALVTARARRGRALRSLISNDGLTGLLNHSSLEQHLQTELARARRQGGPIACAMLDVDRFKEVNDAFGHAAGDRILRNLATLLRQRLRRSDLVGRYGGDEIVVVLPQTDGATARRVLDEIRASFAELRHGEGRLGATFSGGVAVYPEIAAPELLLAAADRALYAAKRAGRNRIVLATG